jgi:hypothetical protein
MQLSEGMAEAVGLEKVHFSDVVIRIDDQSDKQIIVTTASGKTYQVCHLPWSCKHSETKAFHFRLIMSSVPCPRHS